MSRLSEEGCARSGCNPIDPPIMNNLLRSPLKSDRRKRKLLHGSDVSSREKHEKG